MKDSLVQFKTSAHIKQEAMKTAHAMGLDLSALLNMYLHSFVQKKEVHFSLRSYSFEQEVQSRLKNPKLMTEKQMETFIHSLGK